MKYIDAEKLKAEIERRKVPFEKDVNDGIYSTYLCALMDFEDLITSLQQEQPEFKVGDLIVSKYNPHLTYKILATNIPNELGKTDYKVEIFTDGKPGLLGKPHNIRLISSDKIEDWGELVQQEQPEVDLEKEIQEHIKECLDVKFPTTDIELIKKDVAYTARKFYELGLNARKGEC